MILYLSAMVLIVKNFTVLANFDRVFNQAIQRQYVRKNKTVQSRCAFWVFHYAIHWLVCQKTDWFVSGESWEPHSESIKSEIERIKDSIARIRDSEEQKNFYIT